MQGPGNSGTEARIPFVLALVGGIFAAMNALWTGAALLFFGAFFPLGGSGIPLGLVALLLAWIAIAGLVAGFALGMAAVQLYREPLSRRAATWAIVGGAVGVLGGNLISAALGIAAGVMVLSKRPV